MKELKGTITMPELLPFEYGEYIDFVGGRSWSHFSKELENRGELNRLSQLNRYKESVAGRKRYLGEKNYSEKFALEIVYLKISALLNVYRMVQNYRLISKSKFGVINDGAFRVGVDVKKVTAPGLWTASVAVDPAFATRMNTRVDKYHNYFCINSDAEHLSQSSDHYALGVLLFRSLISNHRQNIAKICEELKSMRSHLKSVIVSTKPINRRKVIEEYFDITLRSRMFSISNLFYKPVKFPVDSRIDSIWKNLLLVGLRLVSHDVFNCKVEIDVLAKDWLSIESNLLTLSGIKDDAKHALLYETSSSRKDLRDIVSALISDKEWLSSSLQQITKFNLMSKSSIENNRVTPDEFNSNYKYIDSMRSILNSERARDNNSKLELVPLCEDAHVEDSLLKETIMQKTSIYRENNTDKDDL